MLWGVRLFVYGTLLSGGSQHARMADARPLGRASSRPQLTLVDVGWHPAVVEAGHTAVVGELYEVDQALLAELDAFEGVPTWYQRVSITLADGSTAMTYVMRAEDARGYPPIESGDWITYYGARGPQAITEA